MTSFPNYILARRENGVLVPVPIPISDDPTTAENDFLRYALDLAGRGRYGADGLVLLQATKLEEMDTLPLMDRIREHADAEKRRAEDLVHRFEEETKTMSIENRRLLMNQIGALPCVTSTYRTGDIIRGNMMLC